MEPLVSMSNIELLMDEDMQYLINTHEFHTLSKSYT